MSDSDPMDCSTPGLPVYIYISMYASLCYAYSLSSIWLFSTPWTVAHQAPLFTEILQVRIREWVVMPYSRGSSQPRNWTDVSCIAGGFFTSWAPREAPSAQLSSVAQSCLTLSDPMNRSTPGFPVHHQLPESTQTYVHCVGNTIQPSHPLSSLFLLPSIFCSIRVFSNELALRIRWPKYWSFSFNISPSNEHPGLIS